ncbi:MAG: hypothetical protein KGI54_17310 [Pseudomonadota bacterium]|nr:hypothetical protein [Pseudomonadota bacterium]
MTDEKMDWLKGLLEDWAVWMRSGGQVQGYAHRSAVFSAAGTKNVEDTEREVFMSTCSAVNACIDDLSTIQQCAIQKRYMYAVWRFPRDNYAEQLLKAHELLLISVPKRVEFV